MERGIENMADRIDDVFNSLLILSAEAAGRGNFAEAKDALKLANKMLILKTEIECNSIIIDLKLGRKLNPYQE